MRYQLYSNQTVQPEFGGSPKFVELIFWNLGTLTSSGQFQHAQLIKEDIENSTKKFLTTWNLDTKPQ
jgi:hypothetical protein